MKKTLVAVDIKTGRHLREATDQEAAAYWSENEKANHPVSGHMKQAFFVPIVVDGVLIELYCGPGGSHTPGRFL